MAQMKPSHKHISIKILSLHVFLNLSFLTAKCRIFSLSLTPQKEEKYERHYLGFFSSISYTFLLSGAKPAFTNSSSTCKTHHSSSIGCHRDSVCVYD